MGMSRPPLLRLEDSRRRRCSTPTLPLFPFLFLLPFLLPLLLSSAPAVWGHAPRLENQRGFLFDPTHTQFSLPLPLDIGLLGLDGSGGSAVEVSAPALQHLLTTSLPVHVPANVELQRAVEVQFHLEYRVQQLPSHRLTQLEELLSQHMQRVGETAEGIEVYDVAVEKIEPLLDQLYEHLIARFSGVGGAAASSDSTAEQQSLRPPVATLFLNPSKARLRPDGSASSKPFIYRYRYEGGVPTQQWLAKERYIVLDLAAGPCAYGASQAGEGTVDMGSMPQIEIQSKAAGSGSNVASPKFLSQLSFFVLSAVQHVFVSDLQWSHLPYAEKVIVPLVVFRNHRQFHPLRQEGGREHMQPGEAGPVNDIKIDLDVIKQQVQHMLLPEQELLFVHGTHDLHDHPHLSTAVFKSLKQDSVHTASADGVYRVETRPYLDSELLLEELENAADEVVSALMKSRGSSAPSSSLPGELSARPAGHHVLPVFVLSLVGLPADLLLDHKALHVATSRCVLVLQTPSHAVPVPYFSEGELLHLNPRSPTRSVLAGLATALGGINPPYSRFHLGQKRLLDNYLWAHGALPWGPFSRSLTLSRLLTDHMIRSSVVSRVSSSLRAVRRSMQAMVEFHQEFIEDSDLEPLQLNKRSAPFGTPDNRAEVGGGEATGGGADVSGKHSIALLARDVSIRLAQELSAIESQFLQLSVFIQQLDWSTAHAWSGNILTTTQGFERYVRAELQEARHSLHCCRKEYEREDGALVGSDGSSRVSGLHHLQWLLGVLSLAALGGLVFIGLSSRVPYGPVSYNRQRQILRPTIGAYPWRKQPKW